MFNFWARCSVAQKESEDIINTSWGHMWIQVSRILRPKVFLIYLNPTPLKLTLPPIWRHSFWILWLLFRDLLLLGALKNVRAGWEILPFHPKSHLGRDSYMKNIEKTRLYMTRVLVFSVAHFVPQPNAATYSWFSIVLIESWKDAYKNQLDKTSKINKMWMNMTRSMIFF